MVYEKVGNWAFIGGVVLAIILGLGGTFLTETMQSGVIIVLTILGLVVGFMNIAQKETGTFLIAAIALLAVGAAGLDKIPVVGVYIVPIITNIGVFVAPAAVIIALKAIYDIGYKQ